MAEPHGAARPRLESWFHDTVSGRRTGPVSACARGLLRGASAGYAAGLMVRDLAYALRLVRPVEVEARVISVGNITLGGTGKTPAVMYLAQRLHAAGERVAILIRGHGGERVHAVSIVHDGEARRLGVDEVGDEAVLLAERLGDVPVLAGKDRRLTAATAMERFDPTVLLLDDGFQYRRLAIDEQVVLLDATQPFGTGRLFPAGTLRDPPGYLNRATQIWLTRTDHPDARPEAELLAAVRALASEVPVYSTRHQPARLWRFPGGQRLDLTRLAGARVMGMAGIGNPSAFWATLRAAGVGEVVPEPFPDHHRYQRDEIDAVVRRAEAAGCAAVVTTEKDAVRLELWPAGGPELWVLGIELVFADQPPEVGGGPPA